MRSITKNIGILRRFNSGPPPPVVPTAQDLAKNDETIRNFRGLQHSAVTPKFMGHDLSPPSKYIEPAKSARDIQALSGVPEEQLARTALIGPRKLKTLQSGSRFANQWTIQWKSDGTSSRWSNPIMGWTSGSDPMHMVKLHFDSKESAITYAKNQGWAYELLPENQAPAEGVTRYPMRTYGDNFLTRVTMEKVNEEGGVKSKEFFNAGYGKSNWFPPQNYHGTGNARQHGDQSN